MVYEPLVDLAAYSSQPFSTINDKKGEWLSSIPLDRVWYYALAYTSHSSMLSALWLLKFVLPWALGLFIQMPTSLYSRIVGKGAMFDYLISIVKWKLIIKIFICWSLLSNDKGIEYSESISESNKYLKFERLALSSTYIRRNPLFHIQIINFFNGRIQDGGFPFVMDDNKCCDYLVVKSDNQSAEQPSRYGERGCIQCCSEHAWISHAGAQNEARPIE